MELENFQIQMATGRSPEGSGPKSGTTNPQTPASAYSDRLSQLEKDMSKIRDDTIKEVPEKLRLLRDEIEDINRRFDSRDRTGNTVDDFRVRVDYYENQMADLRRQVERDLAPLPPQNQQAGTDRFPIPMYSGEGNSLSRFLKHFYAWALSSQSEEALNHSRPIIMTGDSSRRELESEYGRQIVAQSLTVWNGLTKAVEKDKTIADIVVRSKAPSDAWKILKSMVEDDSRDRARELAKKQFKELSMNDAESMKEHIARAKSLALNVKYHSIEVSVQEISRRVLNGLPPSYAPEKRNFALKTDYTLAELEGGLVRVEEPNRSSDGTDGSHALATGFKARSGGRSGGRGGHSGGGRGKRDGKGRPPNQRQLQHQPRHQREQQPAHQPQQQQYQPRHQREQQPAHQQQYQQRHQQYQHQEPQQQYQRYQPRHQPQQPAQRSEGWGSSRVCFRCGKHGHFLSECRAVPPRGSPDPYTGAQAATYSYSEDYADFGSDPPPSQSAPAPPDLHGPPVPSESSWSSFSEQATLAQFAPPGKFHVPNESVVGDVTVPGSYLHSAFVVQSGSSEDDVWIADSGASCHMTHDSTRMYNARPHPPGRETITIGDRRRIKAEYIGNMDVIFHGKSNQRSTLIDVACVPDLGSNLYSLHAVQRTHLVVSDASGTHIVGENSAFPRSSSGSYLRATRLPAGTVGVRRKQGEMHATNILRQVRHPVPPPSSRNVTSHYSKAPWTTPVRTARLKPPRDTYVLLPKSVPVAALSPVPAAAPLAPAPASTTPPASVLKPPALIPPRVGRDIKNEGNVGMPGRTRDKTCAMRDALQEYAHRHGVLSTMEHAALVSMLATRESTNKIVRPHSAPKDSPDLPTAHIQDISKPSSVSDVKESPHVDWRNPMSASRVVT